MTESQTTWYIVKVETGHCQIIPGSQIEALEKSSDKQLWGPFGSQADAIARRVGLIRVGKCKPI